MSEMLQIMKEQMVLGDVKTITRNGGLNVRFIELLFSPTTKAQFAPSEDKKTVVFTVSDNNLELPQLSCNMNKKTLRDLILNLTKIYNELSDQEETT